MSDELNEFKGETKARLNSLEDKSRIQDNRIMGLERYGENLAKLSTLVEMQTEINKEQAITLKNMNENLTGLNNAYKNLDGRVGDLEKTTTENNDNKFLGKSGRDIFKKVIPAIISGVIGGLLLAWIASMLGVDLKPEGK